MQDFIEFLESSEPGTYVAAKFTDETNKNLKKFALSLGLNPIKDFHATIVYSVKTLKVDNTPAPFHKPDQGVITGIKYLGEESSEWRAVVLTIKSKILKTRFDYYVKEKGYKSKYPEYIQHVSLAYKPPEDLDLKKVVLPKFKIEFKEEIVENLN